MLEQLVNAPTIDHLSRGMRAAQLRQEVISNNIANVNTPNFKRSEVMFESLLAQELDLDEDVKKARAKKLKMARTQDKHMGEPDGRIHAEATIELDNSTTMRTDNNNVDIDIEMADLAKNQLYYSAMAKEMGSYFQRVKNVLQSK